MRAALLSVLLATSAAAHGAIVAEAVADGERLELHDQVGPCVGGALMAVYESGRERIPGCWRLSGQTVTLVLLDGTWAHVPARSFRAPKTL